MGKTWGMFGHRGVGAKEIHSVPNSVQMLFNATPRIFFFKVLIFQFLLNFLIFVGLSKFFKINSISCQESIFIMSNGLLSLSKTISLGDG